MRALEVTDGAGSQVKDKPYAFAILTGIVAIIVTAAIMLWGGAAPESVLIGLEGRHDGVNGGERLAACLDCHVPFVGTPGSRCLGPGCHAELATGTPPKDGLAMPIRFHAVLRDRACSSCHAEHVELGARTSTRAFTHELIPTETRTSCHRCHSGSGVRAHPRADTVECDFCHAATSAWKSTKIDHSRVAKEACDLCHAAPDNPTHASVAGTCQECHESSRWTPKPPEAKPTEAIKQPPAR